MSEHPPGAPGESQADDLWAAPRRRAIARIGLGRSGVSLPTPHQLSFQLAHAQARDAVYSELDVPELVGRLAKLNIETLELTSAAHDRDIYLRRPDLGRRLSADSVEDLAPVARARPAGYDAVFVVADGLCAEATQQHAAAVLEITLAALRSAEWRIAPAVIVTQGRVAISDEIGELLRAEQAIILLGERPGLSAPDSLGIYLTYGPRLGNTDAQRNCISGIRANGLSHAQAAGTLVYLMREARLRRQSGVMLKDTRSVLEVLAQGDSSPAG